MLRINCEASVAGGLINEDIAGHAGNAAWVIDGATGIGAALLGMPSDAAWLAGRADRAIRSLLADAPALPTPDLIRNVAIRCRDDLDRLATRRPEGPHEHPSAAIAIVRLWPDGLEFATLGDCRIAYEDADGVVRLFGETGLAAFEARTIALAQRLLEADPDLGPEALREALLPQLLENRRSMNKQGGYWVLGTEPAAADHLDILNLPAVEGRRFAIASDGFLRPVELFGTASPADLLAIDTAAALTAWLDRLREIERQEGSTRAYPRVKVRDDASFLQGVVAREG